MSQPENGLCGLPGFSHVVQVLEIHEPTMHLYHSSSASP
jgi:hypothetical protein